MTILDPTASDLNVRKSLMKFFLDTLEFEANLKVVFDAPLDAVTDEDEWITIKFGPLDDSPIATVFCCSRRDPEALRLSALVDTVMGRLRDYSRDDGTRRIDIYRVDTHPWQKINALFVRNVAKSDDLPGPDGGKYKALTVRMWQAVK